MGKIVIWKNSLAVAGLLVLVVLAAGGTAASLLSQEEVEQVAGPRQFAFTNCIGVEPGVEVISEAIIVEGITMPTPISVSHGEYSINDGPFTRDDGFVDNGQTVRVRHRAGTGSGHYTSTTLTIGDVSDIFTSVTKGVAGGGGTASSASGGGPYLRGTR